MTFFLLTAHSRLPLIASLADDNIPVMLMCAPIIPGLNSDEIPQPVKLAARAGAQCHQVKGYRLTMHFFNTRGDPEFVRIVMLK